MRFGISVFAIAAVVGSPALAQQHPDGDLEEIVITSMPYRATLETLSQGVSVLSGDELARNLEGTIGETLTGLPGVSSTFFGPGASRPVIRGFGGDRVEVLINGLGAIDASTISPDHAVAGQSLSVESVEVIRGPNTLLYGPSAIGGVVNIIDGRIPRQVPADGVDGAVDLHYGTNADERAGAAGLTFGLSDNIAAHVEGSYQKADDYKVPAGALHEEEDHDHDHEEDDHDHEEEGHDHDGNETVASSAVELKTGSVGLSWIGDDGFLGIAVNGTDSTYGVPGHVHVHEDEHGEEEHEEDHEEEHEEEHHDDVSIDLEQVRVDLVGEWATEFAIFERSKFRFAYADYKHKELEGNETATTFSNEGWQGRLELVQRPMGNLSGAMGVQVKWRDFDSVGEEAVSPASKTRQIGVFVLEEYDLGAVTLQGGARLDDVEIKAPDIDSRRDSTGVSASLGAIWTVTDALNLTAHASRTERNPTAEELYSNGPHLATRAFELGNPDLSKETAYSIEGGMRLHQPRWSLHTQVYYTDYKDFIYLVDTGAEEDGLPVRQYNQADASFYGFEAEGDVLLVDGATGDLNLHLQADAVRAKVDVGDNRLPRIPPFSATGGLTYATALFDVGGEVVYAAKQDRVAAFETATPDYTFVNAHLTVRPVADMPDLELRLRVRNLFNSVGYNHVSFLKNEAPLPGRDIRLGLGMRF